MSIIKVDYGTIGGGGTITPMWVNPAPSSSFNAQTIDMDLKGCNKVFIAHAYATTELVNCTCGICDMDSSITIGCKDSRFSRTYTVSENGVSISNQSSTAHGNAYCVPYYIIGLITE